MSLESVATQTASTKRPRLVDGERGPVAYLAGLSCTPPHVADPQLTGDLIQQLGLDALTRLWTVYVFGIHDIRGGDLMIIGGREYLIRAVAPWVSFDPEQSMAVTMEEYMSI